MDPLQLVSKLVLACLLLSYPWLSPALQQRFIGGVPAVVVYLFVVWGAIILLVAVRPGDE